MVRLPKKAEFLAIALAFGLWGCASGPIEEITESVMAISGGTKYTGHPAVGLIRVVDGACTGTLVGQQTVLTAAHCIREGKTTFLLDTGEEVSATIGYRHPLFAGDGEPYDIGVIKLESSPTTVRPLAVAKKAPTEGEPIVIVGYGVTYCESVGGVVHCTQDSEKRRAENKIAKLSSIEFTFVGAGNTCKGDSGGPAFAVIDGHEVQVGVTSRGQMPCGELGIDTRVDAFIEWLEDVSGGDIHYGSPPSVSIVEPAQAATLPEGPVDVKVTATDDSGTIVSTELHVDGALVRTLTEAPFEFSVDLQPGAHTIEAISFDPAGNRGESLVEVTVEASAAPLQPLAFGAECQEHADCDSGVCVKSDGRQYCSEQCLPATNSCPAAGKCVPAEGSQDFFCALSVNPVLKNNAPVETFLVGGCQLLGRRGASGGLQPVLLVLLIFSLTTIRSRKRNRKRNRKRKRQETCSGGEDRIHPSIKAKPLSLV